MESIPSTVTAERKQISMSGEVIRKGIHLASLTIPIAYSFFTQQTMLLILIPFTAIALFLDYGRHYAKWVRTFVNSMFASILREHETDSKKKLLSGGSYVLISACLCIIVFPKVIAITAFAILIVSDAISALLGRRFGKHKFLDKSVEGSTAFFLSALIVVSIAPKASGLGAEYVIGTIGAFVGTLIEAASVRLKVDDNFSVPCSIGIVMWLAYYLISVIGDPVYSSVFEKLMK
ncbi:MAG TPA: dolichol kinase [Candidatus Kapabacteria bacterium]|nr:dolichol kinase [Candidatus Kapabacteria bacterium]